MQSSKNSIASGAVKINILGVNVSNITRAEALNEINGFLNGQKQYFIVTPNPEIILQATEKDEELWYILNHANLALADGVALKFAGWLHGKNIKRITGADLVIDILKLAQTEKKKIAIFNWSGGLSSADQIKFALAKRFPGLTVYVKDVDRDTAKPNTIPLTPFPPERLPSSSRAGIKGANLFAPDIIFCDFGAPFQEKFIYYNLAKIPSAKIGMSVGGSFDFLTGQVKRAPVVLKKIGLEWFWRLIRQPGRAARIYRATVVFPFRFLVFFFILPWFYRPNISCLLYKKEIQSPFVPLSARTTAVVQSGGYQGGKKTRYKILIVKRVGEIEDWQLPQGGTDGESLLVAGARELKEELNTENTKPVAVFKNLFKYRFSRFTDKYGFPMKNQRGYRGQKQSLFIAEFMGQDSEIKINPWEHSAWLWVDAEKLVEAVHPVRREATKIFMEKFWEKFPSLTREG